MHYRPRPDRHLQKGVEHCVRCCGVKNAMILVRTKPVNLASVHTRAFLSIFSLMPRMDCKLAQRHIRINTSFNAHPASAALDADAGAAIDEVRSLSCAR